jgi:ribose 5-phosphate isomerase A
MQQEALKKIAAEAAAKEVQDGMIVALGTGSTAFYATDYLGKSGVKITGVPTSVATEKLAIELGIPLKMPGEVERIDILIDGADEVLETGEMIKGGGGALLREKIIASQSKRLLYVVDESKFVTQLGQFPLPLEVNIFGHEVVMRELAARGYAPALRKKDGKIYETENHNYIVDCSMQAIEKPAALEAELNLIPGVVENGLFINRATELFIASASEVKHIKLG